MLSKNISQAISDMISKGLIDEVPPLSVPTIKILDIYPLFSHLMSDKAAQAMANKTTSLIHQYNEKLPYLFVFLDKLNLKSCQGYDHSAGAVNYIRKFDQVRFLGSRVPKENIHAAVFKIVQTINDLADKDFVKAHMLQLGLFELARTGPEDPDFFVISYITLTAAGYSYAMKNHPNLFFEEGGIPKRVEDQ